MRDREMGRGSVLLSSWNDRDRAVLPGSVPQVVWGEDGED